MSGKEEATNGIETRAALGAGCDLRKLLNNAQLYCSFGDTMANPEIPADAGAGGPESPIPDTVGTVVANTGPEEQLSAQELFNFARETEMMSFVDAHLTRQDAETWEVCAVQ
jgi:hypothetical protein